MPIFPAYCILSRILTVRADGIFGSSTISPPRVFILKIKIESSQLMQLNFSDISSLFSISSIIISSFEHEIKIILKKMKNFTISLIAID